MKNLISLLLFPTVAFAAGPITPPTPRTAFGQELMLATNAEDGRAILDITATNAWFAGWASTTNQLVFTNKHKLTNLYDVKAIDAANGMALFFNTDGYWYPSNVTQGAGSGIETNQHLTNIVQAAYKDYTNSLPGLSNVIWVSPTANDAQAARGVFNRPYSLSNGINSAVSGDTVLVLGGTYTNNTLNYWGVAPLVGSYHIQTKNHITIQGIGEVNIISTNGGTTMMLWEAEYVTIAGLNFIGSKNDYL